MGVLKHCQLDDDRGESFTRVVDDLCSIVMPMQVVKVDASLFSERDQAQVRGGHAVHGLARYRMHTRSYRYVREQALSTYPALGA